ncbi:hypothetical protein WMZ97_01625 [Lentibacillus sp. N15]
MTILIAISTLIDMLAVQSSEINDSRYAVKNRQIIKIPKIIPHVDEDLKVK